MSDTFSTPYQGYDVIAKQNSPSWNDITREAVRRRIENVPSRQFLNAHEYMILEAACERLVPQPERTSKVPIAPWIDHKLHLNLSDGYRYETMPPHREAWRLGLNGLSDEATLRFGADFISLSDSCKDEILSSLQKNDARSAVWQRIRASQFFSVYLLFDCITIYYATPDAWSEIGFGGPASPRGYVRMDAGIRDPWEAPLAHAEVRNRGNR